MLSWVISAAWLEESILDPLDLPEWLVPSLRLLLGTGRWMPWTLALLFLLAALVLLDPWGALCSCCACILSLMCHLRWDCTVPPSLASSAALPCSGLVPRSFWSWGCWSKHPIPVACGSSLLNCTAPFCVLHVLSRPWALVFGSGLSVFGAQVQAVGQGRLWLALGITWEKLPGMSKGIIWTRARER